MNFAEVSQGIERLGELYSKELMHIYEMPPGKGKDADQVVVALCRWASSFAPGLQCPELGRVGTHDLYSDSMNRLPDFVEEMGSQDDKVFFEGYYSLWGAGSNFGMPWQSYTGEDAYFGGCTMHSYQFWKYFFDEISKRKKRITNRFYLEKLTAHEKEGSTVLVAAYPFKQHSFGWRAAVASKGEVQGICSCSAKEDVVRDLLAILEFLRNSNKTSPDYIRRLENHIELIKKEHIRVFTHPETMCGGG